MSRLEKKLDAFMAEFRAGRREGSVISTISAEDVDPSDDFIWQRLRSELEDLGVSPRTIDEKRTFIVSWFAQALKAGDFEEDSDGTERCDEPSLAQSKDGPFPALSEGNEKDDATTTKNMSPSVPQGSYKKPSPQKRFLGRRKIVIIGDSACGKTSLLTVFRGLPFPNYVPTVYECYHLDFTDPSGKCIELSLWDTGGLEDYDRLRPLSYSDTSMFLVSFAIDSPDSLENVKEKWIPELKHFAAKVPRLIVGLKSDLRNDPKAMEELWTREGRGPVSVQEGEQIARELASGYMECSSKTGEGVQGVLARANQLASYHSSKKNSRKAKGACVVQ